MPTTNSRRDGRFFDRWAPSYDQSIHQRLIFVPVHNAALDAFSGTGATPHDVLDVGCGTGRLLESAARRWGEARLTGIDVSEAMVAQAQRKHASDARFTFKQGDASALPLESASFDAAFSTMSFHHWGDQAQGLREIVRILRPNGLLVLADVDHLLLSLLRPLLNYVDHASFQTPRDIRRSMEQAGLSVVTLRRFWRLVRVQLFVARKREESEMRS